MWCVCVCVCGVWCGEYGVCGIYVYVYVCDRWGVYVGVCVACGMVCMVCVVCVCVWYVCVRHGVLFVVRVFSMERVGCVLYTACVKGVHAACAVCAACMDVAGGVCTCVSHVCQILTASFVSSAPTRHSLHYLRSLDSVPLPQNHCYTYISLVADGQADRLGGRGRPEDNPGEQKTPHSLTISPSGIP